MMHEEVIGGAGQMTRVTQRGSGTALGEKAKLRKDRGTVTLSAAHPVGSTDTQERPGQRPLNSGCLGPSPRTSQHYLQPLSLEERMHSRIPYVSENQ